MMRYKTFADFCQVSNNVTLLFGYDFCNNVNRPPWIVRLMRLFTLVMCCSQAYCCFYMVKQLYNLIQGGLVHLELFLRLVSGVSYALFASLKFVLCVWNLKKVRVIYELLKDMYPVTAKDCRMARVNEWFWPRWIQLTIHSYIAAVALFVVSPVCENVIVFLVKASQLGWSEASFSYAQVYGFPYGFNHRTVAGYLLCIVIETMHGQFVVTATVCADVWILCFSLQICMHLDYVCRSLEQYEPNEHLSQRDNEFLANILDIHQRVLNICNLLNDCLGVVLLLDVMSIASCLIFAGVFALTQGVGRELLAYLVFMPTSVGQFYLICHYGQMLIETSLNVAQAAYNHPWYKGSQSYKKCIFILIIRAQKEAKLNAVGLATICLETFQMVMGSSYRFFAIIKQTMLEE